MNTIMTSDDTPPPLMLALNMLANMTTQNGVNAQPINFQYNHSNVLDLSQLAPELQQLNQESIVPFLTLFGQLAWRYIPALLETGEEATLLLDTPNKEKYLLRRNLTSILPDGSSFIKLRTPLANAVSSGATQKSCRHADKQAAMEKWIPRMRLGLTKPDYRYLPDYTVLRTRAAALNSSQASVFVPRHQLHASREIKDARSKHVINAKFMDKYSFVPFIKANPATYTRSALTQLARTNLTPLDALTATQRTKQTRRRFDASCDHNPFSMDGSLRVGTFISTPIYTAELEPMSEGHFGYVDIDKRPFRIVLNSNVAYPRLQMSFAHELLHILMEMHKINLPHETLHELALMLVNEVMPGLQELADFTSQQT